MSLDAAGAISFFIQKSSASEPHLAKGLSTHFKCVLSQVLDRIYPAGEKEQGAMIGGKVFHSWIQGKLPSGFLFNDTWLVIGHEQFVILFTENGDRRSPIDTLLFNVKTSEYEIWDWKTTKVPMAYIYSEDPIYKAQANLYAYRFKIMNGLNYEPVCRIIHVNKDDWCETKEFSWRADPILFQKSLERIKIVDRNVAALKDLGFEKCPTASFRELADGLNTWSDTKKPYRKNCKYCDHKDRCVKLINASVGADEIDTAEKVF